MLSQLKRNKIALSDSEKANERKLIHTVFKLNIVMKLNTKERHRIIAFTEAIRNNIK
jgi:hypothetical protein